MKIQKSELAGKISKVKSIVPKKTPYEAIQGVLIAEDYLIANNMETAAKVKLEASTDTPFIIPARAFDLITNLPDGEIEIKPGKDSITIQTGKIKNKFATHREEDFQRPTIEKDQNSKSFTLSAEEFLSSLKRVAFAIGENTGNAIMNTLCLKASDGKLNYIGLDGHLIAWDKVDYEGEFELLIPKAAVDKLLSIGIVGELTIEHNATGALFTTKECEISTRLVTGEYFNVDRMLQDGTLHTEIGRSDIVEALNRARTVCMGEKAPVKLQFSAGEVKLATAVATADYSEEIPLAKDIEEPLTIAFDSKLLIECLRAFGKEEVNMTFSGSKMPLTIREEGSEFLTVLLPVNIGGDTNAKVS